MKKIIVLIVAFLSVSPAALPANAGGRTQRVLDAAVDALRKPAPEAAPATEPPLPEFLSKIENSLRNLRADGVDSIKMQAVWKSSYHLDGQSHDMKGLRFDVTERQGEAEKHEFEARLLNPPHGATEEDIKGYQMRLVTFLESGLSSPFGETYDFLKAKGVKTVLSPGGRKAVVSVPGADGKNLMWGRIEYVRSADRSILDETRFNKDGTLDSRISHRFSCKEDQCLYLGQAIPQPPYPRSQTLTWGQAGGIAVIRTFKQEMIDLTEGKQTIEIEFSKAVVDKP